MVRAGAGFGKSTLLGHAIDENRLAREGLDWTWRCSSAEAAPERLAIALCTMAGLEPPEDWAEAVVLVAERVWAQTPVAVALIFDDAHLLWPNGESPEVLLRLLDELPTNGHLVVASRTMPPLPMGRIVVSGSRLSIDEQEMCFTAAELRSFAELRGVVVDRPDAVWPALAELAASGGGDPDLFLWEQVLSTLTVSARQALWWLITLDGGDDQLLSAAMNAPVRLRTLLDGVPLVTYDDSTWNAHGLWSEHLHATVDDTARQAGVRAAATILTDRGAHPAAFRLLARDEDWSTALTVVRAACTSVEPLVPLLELRAWESVLPEEVGADPVTLLLRAMVARTEDVTGGVELLSAASAAFRERGDFDGELVALTQLARSAYWTGRIDVAASVVGRLTEMESLGIAGAGALAEMGRGLMALVLGEDGEALRVFRAVTLDGQRPDVQIMALFTLISACITTGWVEEAVAYSQIALHRATRGQRSLALNGRVQALWYAGEDDLDSLYDELLAIDTAAQLGHNVVYTHLRIAMGAASVGDTVLAAHHLSESSLVTHSLGASYDWFLADIAGALVALATGSEEEAASRLRASLSTHALTEARIRRTVTAGPALFYMLDPVVRTWLDGQIESHPTFYGPHFHDTIQAARAVLRLREGGSVGSGEAALAAPSLRSMLPIGWAMELAAGLLAAGESDAAAFIVKMHETNCRPHLDRLLGNPQQELAIAARALAQAVPHRPPAPVRVCVFGPARIRHGDADTEVAVGSDDAAQLLALLVIRKRASYAAITSALWPSDATLDAPSDAPTKLTAALRELDAVLEPGRPRSAAPCFVRDNGSEVWVVAGEDLSVDVWEFESYLDEALDEQRRHLATKALDALLTALAVCGDELLGAAPAAPWAAGERDRLRAAMADSAVRAGQLLVGAGRFQEALSFAERALRADPTLARAHRLAAEAHAHAGNLAAAKVSARASMHYLGASPPDPQWRSLLVRFGVLSPVGGDRSTFGWRSLTPAERGVIDFVAEGLTNREIAAHLGVSVRTIDAHVSHVFTKLGLRTRAQLAVEATRRAPDFHPS